MGIEIFHQLRMGYCAGKNKEIKDRIIALAKLRWAIVAHEEDIFKAAQLDFSRPAIEVMVAELAMLVKEIDCAIKNLIRWAKPKEICYGFLGQCCLYPEPYGVVLIIAPWNFSFLLNLLPLVHAIAAGNGALIKPSEYAPAQAALIEKIVHQSLDPGIARVVQGNAIVTQQLLQLPFDYIFFTGSGKVGTIVYQEAAKQLIPATLELGGKNATLVTDTAYTDNAAQKIVWGKFFNAGQCCLAPDYVLVDESIQERFVAALKKYVLKFYGPDAAASPDYARIVNEEHVNRLESLLRSGKIEIGGKVDYGNRYISPTIMTDIDVNAPIMQEEIFGPILPIIPYKNLDEAIAFIKKKPKPLALYVFSSNRQQEEKIIDLIPAGGCCINNVLVHHTTSLPFGGVGLSGIGAYHGKYGFDTFTHYKPVLKSRGIFNRLWPQLPYKSWYLTFIRWWYR